MIINKNKARRCVNTERASNHNNKRGIAMTDEYLSLPRTRKEALASNSNHYFTGKPCKHGHLALRRTDSCACVHCTTENERRWRTTNVDRIRKNSRQYYRTHKEYYADWRQENEQENRHKRRVYAKQYLKDNASYFAEAAARRKASKQRQTPIWYESGAVKKMYEMAKHLNGVWGTNLQVDHIIPLTSDTVCGLHCLDNLQLLDAPLNVSKSNNYEAEW